MSDLRTAAIEAAAIALEDACLEHLGRDLGTIHRNDIASAAVDAVLPLLVAGTASRIADEIEATNVVDHPDTAWSAWSQGYTEALGFAAAIARRVGETS